MVAIFQFVVAVSFLVEGLSASCSNYEFPCNDGSCIMKSLWCDAEKNCKDGSDEDYCFKSSISSNPNKCKDNLFVCKDGSCIPIAGRCDGYHSCHDHSDEVNCGSTAEVTTESLSDEEFVQTTTSTRVPPTKAHNLAGHSTYYPNISYNHATTVKINVYDRIQSDSVMAEKKPKKYAYIDITKGFVKVDQYYFIHEKAKAEAWLLATRDHEYGWGDETARAITALYLSNQGFIKKSTNETMLMIKQLHLMVSIALVRNQTKEMSLSKLASFINALYATCDNPRTFYGMNLVETLRHRTNIAEVTGQFVSPLVYLTLCIGNSTTPDDMETLKNYSSSPKLDKMDMQALVSLAATCISSTTLFAEGLDVGNQIMRKLYDLVHLNGLPGNIYELSLVVQALNEGRINHDRWNRSDALHRIASMQKEDGSFGDILSTYHALPVLSGKSLNALTRHCYTEGLEALSSFDAHVNRNEEKHYISYSLYFGNPVEMSQTLRILVGQSTNLLDIMRIAQSTNPLYRFRLDSARGKPFVYFIGGYANCAERGLYWNLYLSMRNSTGQENLQPYEEDIRTFIPTANDHVVFWRKNLY